MRKWLAAAVVVFCSNLPARAEFFGNFELVDNPGGKNGEIKKLKNNFGYKDPHGIGWEAKAGLPTDGATIPGWAQPFIGTPYDADYIKAAVLHDHYCKRHVYGWRATHEMFYNAMRELGVPNIKASVMYAAVLVGGPKWRKIKAGSACQITPVCIQSVRPGVDYSSVMDVTAASYDSRPNLQTDLKDLAIALEKTGAAMTLKDIENFMLARDPEHRYLGKADYVEIHTLSIPPAPDR